MYQYTTCEKREKILTKIVCNKCKKEMNVENGIPREDLLSVEKRWGYFSEKDGEVHRFDLCETCYNELIRSFAIPVEIE